MTMSQLGSHTLYLLRKVGDELRETFTVEGFTIERGLGANNAFTDGEAVRSAMIRKLANQAASRGAKQAGLSCETIVGGGQEISGFEGGVLRHFRIRRVSEFDEDGRPLILASSPAILEFDSDGLYREERFVLGYVVSALNTVDSVFVAEVHDIRGESPGYLVLGPAIDLEPLLPGPIGFQPAEEDLDDLEYGEDESETGS